MSWGLVLSGGAACGIANAGVLSVLEEEQLQPDYLAGSSMGAIVGALYAMGYGNDVLADLIQKIRLYNVAQLAKRPLSGGIHSGFLQQKLHDHLGGLIGDALIADCKIPFICLAGWMKEPIPWQKIAQTGFTDSIVPLVEPHIFPPETLLLDAIMASSAIPVVFSPVEIDEKKYIDLCHFGAIPSRSLRSVYNPDIVIATDTTPRFSAIRRILPPGWTEFLRLGYESLDESRAACDLIIKPEQAASLLRFDKSKEFFNSGKRAAIQKLPEIKALLH